MKKQKTVRQLKKELDLVFGKWVKQRENKCIVCGSTSNLQAGHFMSRRYNNTRYDPDNVHSECLKCNCFDPNSILEYRRQIINLYGEGYDKVLEERAHVIRKFTVQELEELIKYYKELLK